MDAERLAEIRRLAEAATPGPWIVVQGGDAADCDNWLVGFGRDSQVEKDIYVKTEHLHDSESNGASALDDATFTALARQVIPELLDEITLLKAQLVQEKEQTKYLASLLDPDLVAGMLDMEKTRDRLAMAKVALGEFAELSNYSVNAYSEVQWDGSVLCKHPWNFAEHVLKELENNP